MTRALAHIDALPSLYKSHITFLHYHWESETFSFLSIFFLLSHALFFFLLFFVFLSYLFFLPFFSFFSFLSFFSFPFFFFLSFLFFSFPPPNSFFSPKLFLSLIQVKGNFLPISYSSHFHDPCSICHVSHGHMH